jgi:hypothetical protein
MIPTWMAVDKVVHEMDSVRSVAGGAGRDDVMEQALIEADAEVRALTLASDAEALHRAWRAVRRAEDAVGNAVRVTRPRTGAR